MSKLGTLIREARHARDLSLQDLARKCRASPSYMCRIEGGDRSRMPSLRLLARISDALGLDRDVVFIAAGRMPDDLSKWILSTPGMLPRLRREMAA